MSEPFQRPHPNTIPCEDCGHVWFEGERRHQYVGPNGEVSEEDAADAGEDVGTGLTEYLHYALGVT